MKSSIYVVYDQVSGNYGSVIDFANDGDCIRAFKSMAKAGGVPENFLRDTAVMHIANLDTESGSPVVTPVIRGIVFYGSEAMCNEDAPC